MIYGSNGEPIVACTTQNVSATGALLELERETLLPHHFTLSLSKNAGVRRRCSVAWSFANIVGVVFQPDTP